MLIWQVVHSATWFFFSPPPSCLNFIEMRLGCDAESGTAFANLWQPSQVSLTGFCAFQWQLKQDEWSNGAVLKVSTSGTYPSIHPVFGGFRFARGS
jgi:hypothetical protein